MREPPRITPSCQTCQLCVTVHCHPSNPKYSHSHGHITQYFGYACLLPEKMADQWDNNPETSMRQVIFLHNTADRCECYTPRQLKTAEIANLVAQQIQRANLAQTLTDT